MNLIKAAVFGLVAGAIGAAIWAAVAFFTNFEIGWIAWGIGALVGLGVRAGAGSEDGWTPGILAAVIAVASVVGGKYAAAAAFMNQTMGTAMAPATALEAEESAIVVLADEVVAEKDKRGEAIDWPPGIGGWEDAYTQADYPADIWGEASRRWDATPACYREAARFTPTIASEQVRVSQVAHLIVAESGGDYSAHGFTTAWEPEYSSGEEEIPAALWSQARDRYTRMDDAGHTQFAAWAQDRLDRQHRQITSQFGGAMTGYMFQASFSPWDILWFILAVGSAFKLGSGMASGGE